ncbi:MAG: glutaredoxin family protein [Gammaproteobacteria bacterium]|nr:glutaredoxin family protein [Gammaproteobacteria bacterium]
MATLRVYSRQGCHLCEQLIEALLPLVRGRIDVEICDVDTREDWRRRYDTRVPVLEHDGELVCQYHLDREALARILGNPST